MGCFGRVTLLRGIRKLQHWMAYKRGWAGIEDGM
jgi:hypothetical protein